MYAYLYLCVFLFLRALDCIGADVFTKTRRYKLLRGAMQNTTHSTAQQQSEHTDNLVACQQQTWQRHAWRRARQLRAQRGLPSRTQQLLREQQVEPLLVPQVEQARRKLHVRA